ncbi:MAG: glycoside hydrolase family 4 [Verrucomicrobia bacterium]|nr:glycoside hydrolase family 4 [Verrucomicrobiota bacterium]MDA1086068.1 glycoside hydrolase family 4 [Verrucomicrobiota bacterium]
MARGPKVVLIGAGSVFFGRQTIWSMVTKAALCDGTLALVDPDERKLKWMVKIAERAIEATGVPLKLEAGAHYRKFLKGADFVTLAFAVEGVKLRGVDAELSTKHGMIMCSADTIGPGGTMRTLREVPRQARILKDVEKICPDAWVVNWVNPTAAMGIAIMRHFPNLKFLALCDGPHNPRFDNNLICAAGLVKSPDKVTNALRSQVHIRSGGVNHFNWVVEMSYKGRDLTRKIKEKLQVASQEEHRAAASEGAKRNLANRISWQLADAVGYIPMCVWHTQEYLPFFQGHDVVRKDMLKIKQWSVDVRRRWMNECWTDMRNLASGKRQIEDFLKHTTPDHASDIIESMWSGQIKKFYINTPNNGAVPNLQDDDFLELPSTVDMNRVNVLPFGDMPRPLVGYMKRILDEHELAVEAAVTGDRKVLRQAFLASMVAVSVPDVDACIDELLKRERPYLPAMWYKKR